MMYLIISYTNMILIYLIRFLQSQFLGPGPNMRPDQFLKVTDRIGLKTLDSDFSAHTVIYIDFDHEGHIELLFGHWFELLVFRGFRVVEIDDFGLFIFRVLRFFFNLF